MFTPGQTMYGDFQSFWDNCVKEGAIETTGRVIPLLQVPWMQQQLHLLLCKPQERRAEWKFHCTKKLVHGNGRYANNPWLQELPDPISKVVWDNYVAVSPKYAKDNGLEMNVPNIGPIW